MKREIQAIDYEQLQRDFLCVNGIVGIVVFFTLTVMLLQGWRMLPSFPCAVHEVFHIYCPGCGGTRAIEALLQGHFLQSFVSNPAVILGIFLVLYYETGVIVTLVKKNGKYYYYRKMGLAIGYLGVVLVFAVVRDWLLIAFQIDLLNDFVR